jgi:hypothetical protein
MIRVRTRADLILLLLCILFCTTHAIVHAQQTTRNELGLIIGDTAPHVGLGAGGNLQFNASLSFGLEYDRRLFRYRRATVLAGVDFLASPFNVKLSDQTANIIPSYAYIFATPHLRVQFNEEGTLQPWLLLGGGYAAFTASRPVAATSFADGTNTGAFVFGGGVDTKPLLHVWVVPIGARLEVRDFYSGVPNYNAPISSSLQNNVAYTGGLLIRF